MDRTADDLIDVTWIAWAAERLREQWPRTDAMSLEETARELWADAELRACGPRQAAEKWLRRGIPTSPAAVSIPALVRPAAPPDA
jgi:uncharacterized protein (DUF1684 family)